MNNKIVGKFLFLIIGCLCSACWAMESSESFDGLTEEQRQQVRDYALAVVSSRPMSPATLSESSSEGATSLGSHASVTSIHEEQFSESGGFSINEPVVQAPPMLVPVVAVLPLVPAAVPVGPDVGSVSMGPAGGTDPMGAVHPSVAAHETESLSLLVRSMPGYGVIPFFHHATRHRRHLSVGCLDCFRECSDRCVAGSWCTNTMTQFPFGCFLCFCCCMDDEGRPILVKKCLKCCCHSDGECGSEGYQICAYFTCGFTGVAILATLATAGVIG